MSGIRDVSIKSKECFSFAINLWTLIATPNLLSPLHSGYICVTKFAIYLDICPRLSKNTLQQATCASYVKMADAGQVCLGVACSYFRDCPLPHIAHDGDNGEVLFRYLECQRDLN